MAVILSPGVMVTVGGPVGEDEKQYYRESEHCKAAELSFPVESELCKTAEISSPYHLEVAVSPNLPITTLIPKPQTSGKTEAYSPPHLWSDVLLLER